MNPFRDEQEAKEFLAARISAEAAREGNPLSEVERKMLYFSEGGWTLSEMSQVKEAFVRDYDEDEYERKIAGLVRRIYAREDRSAEEIEAWNDATVRLSAADHYLLVSIDGASWRTKGPLSAWLPTSESRGKRPRGDWMRLTLVAVAVFALCAIVMLISSVFGR